MTAWQTRKWIQRKSESERLALIRFSISIVLSFWLVQTVTSAAFGTPTETIVPKPGIIMIVTFENGTTKPVDDPGQPPTTSEGCGEGWGYYVDDPNPICEPLDSLGKGPPKDIAFCAALGCPYNPPNPHGSPVAPTEPGPPSGEELATTPVTPTEPSAAELAEQEPEPEPEPNPGDGGDNGGSGTEEGNTSEEEGEDEISEEE